MAESRNRTEWRAPDTDCGWGAPADGPQVSVADMLAAMRRAEKAADEEGAR